MENTQKNQLMSILKGVFLSFVSIVCLYLILGQIFLAHERDIGQKEYDTFSEGWVWIQDDGERIEIEMPGQYDIERNELMRIENVIPDDVKDNQYLCIRSSKHEMKVYVDDELRKEYSTEDTRLFGKVSAVAFVFVELDSSDAGKTIRMELQTDSSYSGVFHEIYYGEKWEIWSHLFELHGLELCIGIFMVILGVVAIIISTALKISYKKNIEMEFLGWGVFLAAIWILANSVFRQVIFPSVSVISDIAFFMVMLLSVPFILYLDCVQKGRYQKIYTVMIILNLVDAVITTVLHVANIVDFSDTIIYMGIIAAASIAVLILTMIRDVVKGYIREYKLVALGVLAICVASIIQLVLYFKWTNQFSGSIIAISLIFVLIISFINTMNDVLGLEREKQQAITSNEAKGKFLANMSHEIRTPINAVLGMDAMILREAEDENIREYAINIQNAGQTLLALVNDILDFSKIESGKMEIIPTNYEFSSMLHDIVSMIKIKAEDKGLKLNFNFDHSMPFMLYGDEVRVRQVLTNLLTNAVKYTKEGSVGLIVTGKRDGKNILLTFEVEDTGIGIRQEDIHKLFVRFERIEEERNRNIEGTGLGMSITIQLLHLMGSELKVESEYGVGSKFSFELLQTVVNEEPIGNLDERMEKVSNQQKYEASFKAPDARVLVVDDNMMNRKVFINLLKQTQVRVDEAESGFECIELVKERYYDIIFLDHMMPEMDGIETLHKMKELDNYPCKHTPVIALTANAIQGAKELYISEDFDDFMSKPIRPDKLEKMIKELLQAKDIEENHEEMAPVQATENVFPFIEGVNWDIAMEHLMNKELVIETIGDFYSTMTAEKEYLRQCYEGIDNEEGLKNYRVKVHSMKSSLALIGIMKLSEKAKALEMAAANEDRDYIRKNTDSFLTEWDIYKERLSILIPKEVDKVKADYAEVKVMLNNLKTAMEEMDIDMSDDIMKSLKAYNYKQEIAEKIELLATAVVNLDVESATEIIIEVIERIETDA